MAVIILQWLYFSIISWLWGISIATILSKFDKSSQTQWPAIIYFFLGLSAIAFLGNACSIFVKIGLPIHLLLVLFPGLILAKVSPSVHRSYANYNPLKKANWWIALPIFFISLNIVAGATANIDEAGYYLPLVKWIESYKAIPGTALFIARTGFNSSFHMLCAIFSFDQLYEGGVYELNGCLFIWFNYYFITAAFNLFRRPEKQFLSNSFLASALIFPFTFLIDSMDTDYLMIMGGIIVLAIFLKEIYSKEHASYAKITTYWIVVLFFMTSKVFAGFLLAGPLLLLFRKKGSNKALGLLIFTATIYLLPWLTRNIITTGYLIFPLYYLDIINVDWKVPFEMARASYLIVEEFAKIEQIRLAYTLDGVQSLDMNNWFSVWLSNSKNLIIGWVSLWALPVTIVGWIDICIRQLPKRQFLLPFMLGYCLLVLSLWFINFPAIRFGWAWILFGLVLSTSSVIQNSIPKLKKFYVTMIIVLAVASWSRLAYKQTTNLNINLANTILPSKTTTNFDFTIENRSGIPVKVSSNEACHGVTPPCKPFNNYYNIKARGTSIEQGFRIAD